MKFLFLIAILFFGGCKQSPSEPMSSAPVEKTTANLDIGELYSNYSNSPSTIAEQQENAIISYIDSLQADFFRTQNGVYIIEWAKNETHPLIMWNERLEVEYGGYFFDGTMFDSSRKRGKPIHFKVGEMIAGWNEALTYMRKGEKSTLLIPGNLAYGEQGFKDLVPPNANLRFDIEILE